MERVSRIGDVPAVSAHAWAARAALQVDSETIAYGALAARVAAMAGTLTDWGIGPGARVAVYLENRPEYLVSYFGIPAAGAALVPLNTFLSPSEIAAILRDCRAGALITSPAMIGRLGPVLGELPDLRTVILCAGDGTTESPSLPARPEVKPFPDARGGRAPAGSVPGSIHPDDTAVIIYTSGTTGAPKGVMLSHRNLLANATAAIDAVGATPKDRVLLVLPMFHAFTETVCMLAPVMAGMAVILCPRLDRASIRKAITRRRPTIFPGVPALFTAMAHARVGLLSRLLNPVRVYISGGAPLPLETLSRFEKRFGRPLCEGYGLSEAAPVVSLNPVRGPRKPGSVGVPLPGVRLRVVDAAGEDVERGSTGSLLVAGPSVMKGYLEREPETRAALRDGWLHTGDLARLDEEGYLFIMGRSKEMLIYRGMNVYPREIEQVLEEHPAILEAAVIGVPDGARGEVPFAFVVPRPGLEVSESEVRKACLQKLARYKVPRGVMVIEELPRNPAGKVLKDALKPFVEGITPRAAPRRGARVERARPPGM